MSNRILQMRSVCATSDACDVHEPQTIHPQLQAAAAWALAEAVEAIEGLQGSAMTVASGSSESLSSSLARSVLQRVNRNALFADMSSRIEDTPNPIQVIAPPSSPSTLQAWAAPAQTEWSAPARRSQHSKELEGASSGAGRRGRHNRPPAVPDASSGCPKAPAAWLPACPRTPAPAPWCRAAAP